MSQFVNLNRNQDVGVDSATFCYTVLVNAATHYPVFLLGSGSSACHALADFFSVGQQKKSRLLSHCAVNLDESTTRLGLSDNVQQCYM